MTDPIGFTLAELETVLANACFLALSQPPGAHPADHPICAMLQQLKDLLSAEPPTGDVVSRAAVEKMIRTYPKQFRVKGLLEALAALPSAEVPAPSGDLVERSAVVVHFSKLSYEWLKRKVEWNSHGVDAPFLEGFAKELDRHIAALPSAQVSREPSAREIELSGQLAALRDAGEKLAIFIGYQFSPEQQRQLGIREEIRDWRMMSDPKDEILRPEACGSCKGKGRVPVIGGSDSFPFGAMCPDCNGRGYTEAAYRAALDAAGKAAT